MTFLKKKLFGPIKIVDMLFGLTALGILAALIVPGLIPIHDPGIPEWVNEKTSLRELWHNDGYDSKMRYIKRYKHGRKMIEAIVDFHNLLPCVKKCDAEIKGGYASIEIELKNGDSWGMLFTDFAE